MKSYVYVDTGPFFPIEDVPWQRDLVVGPTGTAKGRLLYVFGTVTGREGTPLSSAEVMIWQADSNGLYRHPRAAKPDELDPNFGYFCQGTSSIGLRWSRAPYPCVAAL